MNRPRAAGVARERWLARPLAALQVLISQGEMRMPGTLPLFVGVVVAGLLLVEVAFRRAVRVAPDGRVIPRLTRENGVQVMRSFAEDLSTAARRIRAPVRILSAGTAAGGAHRPLFPTAEFMSVPGNHWLQISNTKGTAAAVRQWIERIGR